MQLRSVREFLARHRGRAYPLGSPLMRRATFAIQTAEFHLCRLLLIRFKLVSIDGLSRIDGKTKLSNAEVSAYEQLKAAFHATYCVPIAFEDAQIMLTLPTPEERPVVSEARPMRTEKRPAMMTLPVAQARDNSASRPTVAAPLRPVRTSAHDLARREEDERPRRSHRLNRRTGPGARRTGRGAPRRLKARRPR